MYFPHGHGNFHPLKMRWCKLMLIVSIDLFSYCRYVAAQWVESTSSIHRHIHNHSHSGEEKTQKTVCSGTARQRTGRRSLGCKVWRWLRLCLLGTHLTLERWAIGAKTAFHLPAAPEAAMWGDWDWCHSGWKALRKSHLMRLPFASSGWFWQHTDFDFRCETASLGDSFRC